jgi:hypothetical protein
MIFESYTSIQAENPNISEYRAKIRLIHQHLHTNLLQNAKSYQDLAVILKNTYYQLSAQVTEIDSRTPLKKTVRESLMAKMGSLRMLLDEVFMGFDLSSAQQASPSQSSASNEDFSSVFH